MNQQTILIVDDEESVRYSFKRLLQDYSVAIDEAKNGEEALHFLTKKNYALTIIDINLPDISGLELLKKIKAIDPKQIVLVITAYGTTETAIKAIQLGAYDYILKPFDIPAIKKSIEDALKSSRLMYTQVSITPVENGHLEVDRLIGKSLEMQEVYKMIGRVASSDINILLRGESGTGKELVARAIYQYSKRSHKPFIEVNCAAIPENLLESELFGYEKGAFTGANRRKIGKFELANEGTIFLDEIGDLSLLTQSKILRVLQEGTFERLGAEQTIQVDVRVIAATNRNLEKLIEEGKFREDLYYRLKVITITLPPLRLRKIDIPELVNYFLKKHSILTDKKEYQLSPEALKEMQAYDWPGNIRELENIIKRAIVLSKDRIITPQMIKEEFSKQKQKTRSEIPTTTFMKFFTEIKEKYSGEMYDKILSEIEKDLIIYTLQETKGNQVKASKMLGISRMMLRDRIAKYKISGSYIIDDKDDQGDDE